MWIETNSEQLPTVYNSVGMGLELIPTDDFMMAEGFESHQVTLAKIIPGWCVGV